MQHHRLRSYILQLAVLQAPQDVLCSVGPDTEVEAVHRHELLVPVVSELQRLQYTVTDEHDVRILVLAFGDEVFVDAHPSVVTVQVLADSRHSRFAHFRYPPVLLVFALLLTRTRKTRQEQTRTRPGPTAQQKSGTADRTNVRRSQRKITVNERTLVVVTFCEQ
uniref:Putative secreted protein n=1 Tax=Anopheles triannulatus TaxID=58253 RepID=A0A2M4B5E9_9DIPT